MCSICAVLMAVVAFGAGEPEAIPSLIDGIENVLQVSPRIYSGGEPATPEAFENLAALGVKTVISVDGATPNVEAATAAGLAYVHIPIGYDGISVEQEAAMAKALRTADGPFYIHCHHGLHRGPAMAAIALMCDTGASNRDAIDYLHKARTGAQYAGLWRDIRSFSMKNIEGLDPELHEIAPIEDFVTAMSDVDHIWDRLVAAQENNWEAPAENPDATPAHQALLMEERFSELVRLMGPDRDETFRNDMQRTAALSQTLKNAISESSWDGADRAMRSIKSTCTKCHKDYRNTTPLEKPADKPAEIKTYTTP